MLHSKILSLKKKVECQWLTSVILTTWEAEIERIKIKGSKDVSQQKRLGTVVHVPLIPATVESINRELSVQISPNKE
jgi:hypothetical protein